MESKKPLLKEILSRKGIVSRIDDVVRAINENNHNSVNAKPFIKTTQTNRFNYQPVTKQ